MRTLLLASVLALSTPRIADACGGGGGGIEFRAALGYPVTVYPLAYYRTATSGVFTLVGPAGTKIVDAAKKRRVRGDYQIALAGAFRDARWEPSPPYPTRKYGTKFVTTIGSRRVSGRAVGILTVEDTRYVVLDHRSLIRIVPIDDSRAPVGLGSR